MKNKKCVNKKTKKIIKALIVTTYGVEHKISKK